jgi:pimeloyl-ACP methyl ester carboxylesterase
MSPLLGLWLLLGVAAEAAPALQPAPHAEPGAELVVLVHGLGRSPLSMMHLAGTLRREGYRVINFGWSSTGDGIEEVGEALAQRIAQARAEQAFERVHLVGHSTGGIAIRWLLEWRRPVDLGRVVLIAPPNHGSRSADRWAPWLDWLFPALDEITTDSASTVRSFRPLRGVEMGVIAGRHDGKVDPAEARLSGAHFALVPGVHTFLMNQPRVQRLTVTFLRDGRFGD